MESASKAWESVKKSVKNRVDEVEKNKNKKHSKNVNKAYSKKQLDELKRFDEINGTDLYNDYLRNPQRFREEHDNYKGGSIQKKARGGSVDYRKTGMFYGGGMAKKKKK